MSSQQHSTHRRASSTNAGAGFCITSTRGDAASSHGESPVQQQQQQAGGAAAVADTSDSSQDLAQLTEEELIALIESAEQKTRVLKGQSEQKVSTIKKLQNGLRETVEQTEREEERMSNALQRRIASLRGEHSSLVNHLHSEEANMKTLEKKLRIVTEENAALERSLLAEEEDIVARLRAQISMVEKQKAEIEEKLSMEAGEVARHMERLLVAMPSGRANSAGVAPLNPSTMLSLTSPSNNGGVGNGSTAAATDGGSALAAGSLTGTPRGSARSGGNTPLGHTHNASLSGSATGGLSAPLLGSLARVVPVAVPPAGPGAAAQAAGLAPPGGGAAAVGGSSLASPAASVNSSMVMHTPHHSTGPGGASGWGLHDTHPGGGGGLGSTHNSLREISIPPPPPVIVSTPLGGSFNRGVPGAGGEPGSSLTGSHTPQQRYSPTAPPRSLASDRSMSTLLQREIDRVKALEEELTERNANYRARIANLVTRVDQATLDWERQRAAADKLRRELSHTRSLTKELVANHELLAEWQAEREIHAHGASAAAAAALSSSQGQTRQSTPRVQPAAVPAVPVSPASGSSRRGLAAVPPLMPQVGGHSPFPVVAGGVATTTGSHRRSSSVANSEVGGESLLETPVGSQRGLSEQQHPPTVLHGGTPMSSARRQFASGSACSERIASESDAATTERS